MKMAILVWKFHDAPKHLRALSGHGGDEDWLAVVPDHYADTYIGWAEEGTAFGCCDVERHEHPHNPGSVVLIGAHA